MARWGQEGRSFPRPVEGAYSLATESYFSL
jgi:hypothetical protein